MKLSLIVLTGIAFLILARHTIAGTKCIIEHSVNYQEYLHDEA
jgi:hypothetical protein